ncbi:MAG: PASTA domain-containing protein [Bacteroides sp.]|nr:PASTA domain-containing protein [Bacteroides sp.]MBD5349135.1 PASTA domain-containing protein [Bacteroides sp.]
MKNNHTDHSYSWGSKFIDRHPVMANIVIIFIIAGLGIYAAYLATALFTKHGRSLQVPGVENLSYTQAISKLHNAGLNVDIRDSIYREDMKPGFVIEQFPKANSWVKPGRKIFLYINAVHPKEVILDDDNHPNEYALKGLSQRSALAKFEELGFKNVRVVKVLGTTDRVVKVLANGKPVRKMQKISVKSSIVIEVSDGRLMDIQDSLTNLEYLDAYRESQISDGSESYENIPAETSEPEYMANPEPEKNEGKSTPEKNTEETGINPDESQYF